MVTLGRKSKASQDVPVAVQEAPAAPSVSLDQKLKSLLEGSCPRTSMFIPC